MTFTMNPLIPMTRAFVFLIPLLFHYSNVVFIPTRNHFAKISTMNMHGITQSKQLCIRKSARNKYIINSF